MFSAACTCCRWHPVTQAIITTVFAGLISLVGNAFSANVPQDVFANTDPLCKYYDACSSTNEPDQCCSYSSIVEEEGGIDDDFGCTVNRILPLESMPNSNSQWMISDYDGSFASLPYYKEKPIGKWFNHMNIPKDDDFHYVKRLGSGQFGEVHAAVLDGRLVALKQFQSNTKYDDIQWEAEMLWRATNIKEFPNLIGFTHGENGIVEMVMDFVGDIENCSTMSMLTSLQDDNPRLSYVEWVGILWDVVNGLREFHRLNLLHCDIKTANVMLTWSAVEWRWCGVIVDVGLACCKDLNPPLIHMTPEAQEKNLAACRHIAPEVIKGITSYTVESDIYAVGTLMFLVATKIKDKSLKQLGASCRHPTASKRPSTDELLAKLDAMWEGESN